MLTLIAAGSVAQNANSRYKERFDNAVEQTQARIHNRLQTYVTILQSGVGLFAAKDDAVTRDDFHHFVSKLDLPRTYPGMQGFGYTERVPRRAVDSLIVEMQDQGYPDFRLWPEVGEDDEIHSIVYLEPMDARNEAAIGFNMYAEETRRRAMDRAREQGDPSLSGIVTLVQEIDGRPQAGFLVYLPVYAGGDIPPTATHRHNRHIGYVYAPFRADDLFSEIFRTGERPRLAFRVYDGPDVDPDRLLHDSRTAGIVAAADASFDVTTSMTLYGRTWTIAFAPVPHFAAEAGAGAAVLLGVLGSIMAVLLFMLSRQQVVAERRALKSEARLQAIIESVPIGMIVCDGRGKINYSNTAHRRLWGEKDRPVDEDEFDVDPVAKEDIRTLIPSSADMVNRALRGTPTIGVVLEVADDEGPRRTTLNSFTPIYSQSGSVDMVVVAEVDITERRRAEAALREREHELQTMVDALPQLAWMLDRNGNAIWFNKRWHNYTGNDLRALVGWGWTSLLHPDDVERVEETLTESLTSDGQWEDTVRIADAEGTYREFLARIVPIFDDRGAVIRWFGTSTDIADQLAARDAEARAEREQIAREAAEIREEQLRQHAAELERSNRELQDFAYVASHDLQEPLRKISTFTDLVREEYSAGIDDEGEGYLQRIQESALRMSRLIKDLLAFSRVTMETEPFQAVDLNEVIEVVKNDLEILISDTEGSVRADDLPVIEADGMQIHQLMLNLIGNALKFNREGVPPEIVVRAKDIRSGGAKRMCRIEVSDNGIGFDQKYVDRIFTPFQRLHPRSEYGGTGIGLAICRRIVERHGGTISARSEEGKGSLFIIDLPFENSANGKAGMSYSDRESQRVVT
jgi:PAS domain S-box-containing protein